MIQKITKLLSKRWHKASVLAIGALMISSFSYGQVLINEAFGTNPPAGWVANNITSTAVNWTFNNPGARTITGGTPGFDANFAILDSDNQAATNENAALESPAFDASQPGSYMLEYDNQYRNVGSGDGIPTVEVWNGTAWVTVLTYPTTAADGYPNPASHRSLNITTATGSSAAAKVRFHWSDGSDDWWWAVDNVTVTRLNCTAPTATYSYIPNCGSNQFSINVNITSMGSATSISIGDGTNTFGPATATGNYAAGPYTSGDTKTITLTHNLNTLCNVVSAAQTFNCPPANDECSAAVALTINSDYACTATTNGTTVGATQSNETAPTVSPTGINDDVWYKFVATATTHRLVLSNVSGSTDMAMAVYSGACGALVHMQSSDPNIMDASGLTIGQEYKVRVYTYAATVTTMASFTLCIGTPPPPPANDQCANAVALTVNADFACTVKTSGTTVAATQSNETAATVNNAGTNDDVWYKFTATGSAHRLVLSNVSGTTDMAMAIYSGACGSLVHIQSSDPNTMDVTGLTPGVEYKVRVYTYTSTSTTTATFDLCVGTPPAMTYVSSTTDQTATASINQGSGNQAIIRVNVVTTGTLSPLTLTQLDFNTTGTTNTADIINAKVYYTGTSTTFATTTQFGSVTLAPNGNFSVTGSQVLGGSNTANANNYFFLTYDVACAATVANTLDAQCTNLIVAAIPRTPTVTNPSGSGAIAATTLSAATNQPSTSTVLTGSLLQQVLRVAASGCVGSNVTSLSFTPGTSTAISDIVAARVYYTTSTTFDNLTQFGSTINNPGATFNVAGNVTLAGSTGYFWVVYDISSSATVGNVVDASCTNVVINGSNIIPGTPNPAGTRTVAAGLANDNAAGATALTVGGGCTGSPYTNVGASWTYGEPINVCYQLTTQNYPSVWFRFTAPASGTVRISTNYAGGTMTDSHVGLYTTTDVNNYNSFSLIACDDDNGTEVANGGGGAALSLLYATGLTPSATYYVMVNGFNNGTGTFCLTVDEIASTMLATTASCAVAQDLYTREFYAGSSSLVDVNGNLIAIVKRNTPNAAGTTLYNYSGNVNVNTAGLRHDVNGLDYLDRNYRISYSTTASTTYDVQFVFLNSELAALDAPLSSINVSHVPGATCNANFTGNATLLTQTANGATGGMSWIKVTTPGFSNFYLMEGITPLPLKLIRFEGQNKGVVNNLTWETAEEKNFSHFELQRSADGIDFAKLDIIKGKNIATGTTYGFTDSRPIQGKNFYRLLLVDNNGKSIASDVIDVTTKTGNGIAVTVHPNPVQNLLHINLSGKVDGKASIQIFDIVGKAILTIHPTDNNISVDMSSMPAGTYIVKYLDSSNSFVTKISKN